jgi:hypothetical protein
MTVATVGHMARARLLLAPTVATDVLITVARRYWTPQYQRETRIGTRGTSPHKLGRTKEGSAMTQLTIQNIPDDHDMLPKT